MTDQKTSTAGKSQALMELGTMEEATTSSRHLESNGSLTEEQRVRLTTPTSTNAKVPFIITL